MRKIRILHVVQAAGGVDRYIRMLLKYLDKEEFENIMVCSQDFHKGDYERLADGFEQIEMNRAIGMSDLKSIREVRRRIKKYNPDIVYAHSSKAGAIARVADIGLKNRCVYNPHGWAFNMRCSEKKKMMYAVIEKIAAPFCDKIICISDAEKQSALHKKICKEEKLQVIFNGVDIKAYENGTHMFLAQYDIDTKKLSDIQFRNKNNFSVREGTSYIVQKGVLDKYSISFLNSISYTENCYHCQYANIMRVSDITLGDSWGSNLDIQEQRKGVSLILNQTLKGKELLEQSELELMDVELNRAIEHNHQLKHPSIKPNTRKIFFDEIKNGKNFNAIVRKLYPKQSAKQIVKMLLIKAKIMGV